MTKKEGKDDKPTLVIPAEAGTQRKREPRGSAIGFRCVLAYVMGPRPRFRKDDEEGRRDDG